MRTRETARYYDAAFGGMTADRDFYVAMAREEGGPVCELAAGSGRVAVPVAAAGVEVVGVDLAEPMLERFRERLAAAPEVVRRRVEAVHGDMRTWGPDGSFAQVFIPFRGLLAMLTRADRHRCLANAHRILRPGGRLVLNVFHPSVSFMRRYQEGSEGALYELGSWDLDDGDDGRLTALESSRFDTVEQRVHTRLRWIEERPDGTARVTEEDLELGYVWRDELVLHLEAAGFTVDHLWGGFDRAPLIGEGQEMVAVARK